MFPKIVQIENPKINIINLPLQMSCLAKFSFVVMAQNFATNQVAGFFKVQYLKNDLSYEFDFFV